MNKTMTEAADLPDGSARVVDVQVRQQLDLLLAGMDAHLDELRAGVVRTEAETAMKRTLCAALPQELPLAPDTVRVNAQVYKADAEMTFAVTSRDQVLSLLAALPGVNVVMVKGGCTTFVPEEQFVEDARGTKTVPVGEVVYRLSTWCDSLQEEYTWWTQLAGRLVYIKASTRKGTKPAVEVRGVTRALGPVMAETMWSYWGLPEGEVMQWHGGDHANVAPITVHQKRGVAFKDAAQGTRSTIARVQKERCTC